MQNEIPSLQQICYDVLAQYAGYIEELDSILPSEIQEICQRTNAFGLANIESLLSPSDSSSLTSFWEQLYNSSPSSTSSLTSLIHGPDFYKQSVLHSLLRSQIHSTEMDDEDLQKLLSLCTSLKILEIKGVTRLNPPTIFSYFAHLLHLSLENSKLGSANAEHIRNLIIRNPCLQTVNLNNNILGDQGIACISQCLPACRVVNLSLTWNDLTFASVQSLCAIFVTHPYFTIVDLSKNLGPRDIKRAQHLIISVRQQKNMRITVV